MAARAIWKGVIRFQQHHVPVKLYSAVQDRNIHFNLLHDQDMVRVRQRMVNPATGKQVERDAIRKGFPIARDRFVPLDEAELAELQPPASREIEILCFVEPKLINHQWYDRPYWLGPDDEPAAYFALVEALAGRQLEATARWTMRNTRYLGALRAIDGYLLLETLRHAEELIDGSALPAPGGRELSEKERKMAAQLIEALGDAFRPGDYHDEHRRRVKQLIEAKRRGESWQGEAYEPEGEPDDLAASLSASLQSIGSR